MVYLGVGKWRTGRPPVPGWYNATFNPPTDILRWWDGATWSICCLSYESKAKAVRGASIKETAPWPIYWRPLRKDLHR